MKVHSSMKKNPEIIRFLKKNLNRIKKDVARALEDEDLIELREESEYNVSEFMRTGATELLTKKIIFGEETSVEIKLEQSLALLRKWHIDNTVIQFFSDSTDQTFTDFINSYYWDVLAFIQVCKDFRMNPVLFLESDMALLYMYVLSYFPEYIDAIEPIISYGLREQNKKKENNIRPVTGNYGNDSIIPLALFMAKEYNRPLDIQDSFKLFVKEPNETYSFVLNNVYTRENSILQKIIAEMTVFHIKESKSSDLTTPFHSQRWSIFPIEIISILKLRNLAGLSNYSIEGNALINMFEPYISAQPPLAPNVFTLFQKLSNN